MFDFFRTIDNSVIGGFFGDTEEFHYDINDRLKDSPNLLCDTKLSCFLGHLSEKLTDSLIVTEPFSHGENVVSDGAKCCVGNLRCEVCALALSKTQILFAILEKHLEGPSPGVNLPGFHELEIPVGGEQSVPLAFSAPPDKEETNFQSVDGGVKGHVIAVQTSGVFPYLAVVAEPAHQCRGIEQPIFSLELHLALSFSGLSDLDHTEPVALHTTALHETDELLACEPAVGQYIREPDAPLYGATYHLFGQLYLGEAVVVCTFLIRFYSGLPIVVMSGFNLFVRHAVFACLALLSYKGKVKDYLGDTVGNSHEKGLETKYALVFEMRVDSAYVLNGPSRLVEVCVIDYKAGIPAFILAAETDLVPKLAGDTPKDVTPFYGRILYESVVYILLCSGEFLKRGASGTEYVLRPHKDHNNQSLKYPKNRIQGIALAFDSKCKPLSHSDIRKYHAYGLHGFCEVIIFEKSFDIRDKRCNFVNRHRLSGFLFGTLKLLIFLHLSKNRGRFFMPFNSVSLTCET